MISTLKVKNYVVALVIFVGFFCGGIALAQDSVQTLSVSPTLFQMSANPGQPWASELRVVNVNNYDITIFPQVVNFAPSGETGRGDLLPVFADETNGQTLAEWVTLSLDGILIPAQQTITVPFNIKVPENAAPGGHYAAILVGTKPPTGVGGNAQVQTAQFVTSLLFVRVSGDVIESGQIREFTTLKSITSTPVIDLDIRFENNGNVHLQPQGDIKIFNMWGTERGVIPINYQTHFGNVLPNSIRKFSFAWTGDTSVYDVGRFKAVATLGYGDSQKKFSTSITYFWVIPLKQILIFTIGTLVVFWFFSFAIKAYIRRVLLVAGVDPRFALNDSAGSALYKAQSAISTKTVIIRRYQAVTEPVRLGIREIATNLHNTKAFKEAVLVIVNALSKYRLFVLFTLVLVALCFLFVAFFGNVLGIAKPFNVTIVNPDASTSISSEEIYYESLPSLPGVDESLRIKDQSFKLDITNASGVAGKAATLKRELESFGYKVSSVGNELGRADKKTVIIYNQVDQDNAVILSKNLKGALLSQDSETAPGYIKLFVGTD